MDKEKIEVICTECNWFDYDGMNTTSTGICRYCGGYVVFIGESTFRKHLAKLFTTKPMSEDEGKW